MTADQRFALIISGMGLISTVLITLVALLWRAGSKWGQMTNDVKHLAESIGQIALDTNERLQWLERSRGRRHD